MGEGHEAIQEPNTGESQTLVPGPGPQQSSAVPNSGASKPFGEHLKSVAAYAFLASFFMIGFGVAAAIWSSSLSPLQTELGRVREERDRSQAELTQVKSEYALYRGATSTPRQSESPRNPTSGGGSASAGSATKIPSTTDNTDSTVQIIRVATESTGEAFGGAVLISLVSTPFGGDPLRHTVIASVGAPGYPSVTLNRKDVGYSLQFNAAKKFDIRIVGAETFGATFRVTVITR